jgi:hypothetical protein
MPARTATPLLTTTLAIAAGTAAILVGCSRHSESPASTAPESSGAGIAYDPTNGGTTDAHATAGSYQGGDATPGSAAAANTTGNAATGITQPSTQGVTENNGAPTSSSAPASQ